jgi:hypothetical protein
MRRAQPQYPPGFGLDLAIMDKAAVEAAQQCIELAEAAIHAMENADTFKKLEVGWSEFLTWANRAYVKLEQGSKTDKRSTHWFAEKKHERRKDPLLKYVKNARDADEHGLKRVTEREQGGVEVTNYGDKYQPPGDDDPITVARKFTDHLKALVSEADKLS